MCVYIYMCTCVHVCVYMCTCVHACVCVCVCTVCREGLGEDRLPLVGYEWRNAFDGMHIVLYYLKPFPVAAFSDLG